MELALHCLEHALVDSVKMVPLLFAKIYVAIEALEIKFGNRMGAAMAKAGKAGPVIGAVAGIIPQCGVSVVGTALYTQRLVTIGTLFAVYLATSDEAIPVILSQPDAAGLLVPLIATKLVIAIVVGYALDIAFRKRNRRVLEHGHDYAHGSDSPEHHHETAFEEKGCCGHEPAGEHQSFTARGLLLHPLVHTLKVWVFIFLTSFVLALAFQLVRPGHHRRSARGADPAAAHPRRARGPHPQLRRQRRRDRVLPAGESSPSARRSPACAPAAVSASSCCSRRTIAARRSPSSGGCSPSRSRPGWRCRRSASGRSRRPCAALRRHDARRRVVCALAPRDTFRRAAIPFSARCTTFRF